MEALVIVAHPDDEVLGCGGTIAGHVGEVGCMCVADGESARKGAKAAKIQERKTCAYEAARIMGSAIPSFLNYPDQRLDTFPLLEIVQAIEHVVAMYKPKVVYTHHAGDLNLDHRIVHQAAMTALRPMPGSTVKRILAFEVPSSTEWGTGFSPNYFVDISSTFERKMKALQAYDAEMRAFPHPRSYEAIEALAKWRGATCGLKMAEAFMVMRWIHD